MKKMLFLTIIFIAVPSFFILTNYEEETVLKQFIEEKDLPTYVCEYFKFRNTNTFFSVLNTIKKNNLLNFSVHYLFSFIHFYTLLYILHILRTGSVDP